MTEEDLPVVLALGSALRDRLVAAEAVGKGRAVAGEAVDARYRDAIADPHRHLVFAVTGDPEQVLGMALFSVTPFSPLLDTDAVHVTHTVVDDKHRKRGAGRALVAAAAAFAEERGIEQIVVSVHPTARDAARFFARLGFAPLSVRRAAPVSVVRRRLALVERGDDNGARRRALRPVASRRAASDRALP